MNYLLTRTILLSFIFSCFLPLNCVSALKAAPDDIARELATLEATVIKGSDERYLLNLGTDNHIKKGSLWTLYSTGEQIIDPGTGKKLGALPVPLAVCKVIRVEKYFSEIIIKCFNEPCIIQSGITAHRFRDIKTTFQDIDGSSFRLYELIRIRLPGLDWQGYRKIENTVRTIPSSEEIVIAADKTNVTIWSGGEILAAYEKSHSTLPSSRASIGQPGLPVTEKTENTSIQKNIPGLSGGTPGLNTPLEVNNYTAVTSIDHPVISIGIMAPEGSETPYFIYLYNKTVVARTMDGTEKYHYNYKGFGDVINMSVGYNGLISLNIYIQNEGMKSRLLKFSPRGFTVLSKNINYFLEFPVTSENGMEVSLVGQNFTAEDFFDHGIFRLGVDDTGKIKQHGTINIPAGFNLPGSIFADLNGNGIQEFVFYNAGGKLVIYEGDKQKWKSPSPFVPVNSIMIDDIVNETNAPADLPLWPKPTLFQSGNLIFAVIPANYPGFWRVVSGSQKNGGIGILCPYDGTYTFRLLNTRFQGLVQSVCMYNNTLYIAVVEGNTFTGKGNTHVLTLPIKDLKKSLK